MTRNGGGVGTGVLVIALLVVGTMALIRANAAAGDAVQCLGSLGGGACVAAAVALMRDSVAPR